MCIFLELHSKVHAICVCLPAGDGQSHPTSVIFLFEQLQLLLKAVFHKAHPFSQLGFRVVYLISMNSVGLVQLGLKLLYTSLQCMQPIR